MLRESYSKLSPAQKRAILAHYRTGEPFHYFAMRYDVCFKQLEPILADLDQRIPGQHVNFEAILEADPLGADPLVIQCQLTLARLNEIYNFSMHRSRDHSGNVKNVRKKETKVNVPPDAKYPLPSYSDGVFLWELPKGAQHKVEETTAPDDQRIRWVETAMKALDRSMRVQLTLTRRQEKLNNPRNQSEQQADKQTEPDQPRTTQKPRAAESPEPGSHSALRAFGPSTAYRALEEAKAYRPHELDAEEYYEKYPDRPRAEPFRVGSFLEDSPELPSEGAWGRIVEEDLNPQQTPTDNSPPANHKNAPPINPSSLPLSASPAPPRETNNHASTTNNVSPREDAQPASQPLSEADLTLLTLENPEEHLNPYRFSARKRSELQAQFLAAHYKRLLAKRAEQNSIAQNGSHPNGAPQENPRAPPT
jgi:hypothetical protein